MKKKEGYNAPVTWLGILIGLVGAIGMAAAYPVYRKFFTKAKDKHHPAFWN